ncbi:hypothetical protein N7467_008022 [Penicillium canescens]|nr:hypothetical protein N7467_008022 [Penicillium canescens]
MLLFIGAAADRDHFICTDSTQFRVNIADTEQNPEVSTSDLDPEAVRDEVRKPHQISDIPVVTGVPGVLMKRSCGRGWDVIWQ